MGSGRPGRSPEDTSEVPGHPFMSRGSPECWWDKTCAKEKRGSPKVCMDVWS